MSESALLQRLFSLEGKTALVTGASGGIGQALAIALAEAGAAVALHGRDVPHLEETQRKIAELGGTTTLVTAELEDVDACRQLITDANRDLGRLDILVNCAGMNRRKPISEVPIEDFDTIMAVNLRSAFVLSQTVQPIMQAQGGGKIVNIGSLTCSIGLGTVAVYGMSKTAMWEMTRSMAVEWAPDNIQVNCLAPGFIITPLTEASVWGDPVKQKWWTNRIPAQRAGTPGDLIGTAIMLASPASDYLTGQLISIDGGFLAGGSWLQPQI